MKPAISPVVIFDARLPWLSVLNDCWEELKKDIAISSPEFYETIKDIAAEQLPAMPHKVRFTVWKYFNRARFRATPFGTFGGFGITGATSSSDTDLPLQIDSDFKVHSFVNWPHTNILNFDYRKLLLEGTKLFSNSSYYCSGNMVRYIATSNKQFELSEIANDAFVHSILNQCLQPIKLTQLYVSLNIGAAEQEEVLDLVLEMIELQLLLTEADPNIIGKDYFERIGITDVAEKTPYLIAEALTEGGKVDVRKLRHIPELVDLLQKIVPQNSPDSLQKFTDNFKRKFELQEVPVMVALDPEIGVGYDELEQAAADDFIKQFTARSAGEAQKGIKSAQDFISSRLNNVVAGSGHIISLDHLNVGEAAPVLPLPNSFSVMATIADELVLLDNVGGVTANALNGRFTLASDAMLEISRNIARQEASANEDIVFFDVAYMAEAKVDNINRRKLVYDKQLSILSFDTSADPLTLDDIMLSVKGKEVILRSKKLNKRLVPRLASAYNYGRSDLSLFRLLCDLQHQGLQTQLVFSLKAAFPDLAWYPRVQFKNLVLSPQMWRIKRTLAGKEITPALMHKMFEERKVSQWFKAGQADQTLCFDRLNADDLEAFVTYASKLEEVMIEEVILPEKAAVTDKNGNPYLAQFILNLNHKERLYRPAADPGTDQGSPEVQFFPPGSEWLYFEIYCHQQRTDELLNKVIAPVLKTYRAVIDNWFFIRFSQYGNHIRCRFRLNDLSAFQKIVDTVSALLHEDMEAGLVADLQVKTYRREIARYGNDLIAAVEKHFEHDSNYVLSLLEISPETLQRYKLCAALVTAISAQCFNDNVGFLKSVDKISAAFNAEHHLDPGDFKKLNVQYQLYLQTAAEAMPAAQEKKFKQLETSFINILNKAATEKRMQLFSDLFHMHVNRLFAEVQRTHEMVIYYFILKDLRRNNAMQRG